MKSDLIKLAQQLGKVLEQQGLMLTAAESCTGGQVAQVITSVSGSASWFERGFVTYSNLAKQEMLGVKPETLEKHGAVSEATAKEMAEGALLHSNAQVSIAVTGVAGPTGGTASKPVGTICFAWAVKNKFINSMQKHFEGDRISIRSQATQFVLQELLQKL